MKVTGTCALNVTLEVSFTPVLVTVLLSVKQKVVRNFAFRAGELNNEHIAEVLKGIPQIAGKPNHRVTENTEKDTEKKKQR